MNLGIHVAVTRGWCMLRSQIIAFIGPVDGRGARKQQGARARRTYTADCAGSVDALLLEDFVPYISYKPCLTSIIWTLAFPSSVQILFSTQTISSSCDGYSACEKCLGNVLYLVLTSQRAFFFLRLRGRVHCRPLFLWMPISVIVDIVVIILPSLTKK